MFKTLHNKKLLKWMYFKQKLKGPVVLLFQSLCTRHWTHENILSSPRNESKNTQTH